MHKFWFIILYFVVISFANKRLKGQFQIYIICGPETIMHNTANCAIYTVTHL